MLRGGKPISKSGLYGILTNALYSGMVDHKGVLYPGEHERIVDQRVWDKVQARLRENGRGNGAYVKNKYGALLRGVLFCAHCDTAMMHTYTAKGPRRYRYYVCYKAQQKGWQNCETKSVAAEAIERAVLNSIRRLSSDPLLAERVLDEAVEQFKARKQEIETEQASMKRSLSHLNQELARLAGRDGAGQPAHGSTGSRAWKTAIRTAERQLHELSLDHQQMKENPVDPAHLRKTIREFEEVWATLTTREQEEVVKLLVSKVVYDGVTGKVTVSFRSAGAKELCQGKAE